LYNKFVKYCCLGLKSELASRVISAVRQVFLAG
jgi:hypothetical protein